MKPKALVQRHSKSKPMHFRSCPGHRRNRWIGVFGTLACLFILPLPGFSQETPDSKVSYAHDILPIFQANCHGCHQPAKSKGGYVMTGFTALLSGGESGLKAILPGNAAESLLVELITPIDGKAEMPQKAEPLQESEIALIRTWIDQGAHNDLPEDARVAFDMEHPPVYKRAPVVTSLDFSSDGRFLAVSGFHEVLIHHADGSGIASRLVGLSSRIESVRFSPDSSKLAVAGGMPARLGEIQIWNVDEPSLALSLNKTFDTLFGVSWSPDGENIAFGATDTVLRAIESQSGLEVFYQGSHDDWVLDTVFSADGKFLASVGRDQTAKLSELETQRFIDNITSITPGALKGGLLAVDRHPERDEILVGGADGAPQIYRMHRETKRVIGDNANLIRIFPPLPGRIFSVAYSPDGRKIAAAGSLDGVGTVQLYSSDFNGELSEDLKKIMEKTSGARSAEDNAMVEAFQTEGIELLASVNFPGALYSLDFNSDGSTLAVSGTSGIIWFLDSENASITRAFRPVPLEGENPEEIFTLSVEPSSINFGSTKDYAQLIVSGWRPNGTRFDLTREAKITPEQPIIEVNANGFIQPKSNGKTRLQITHGNHTASIPVEVVGMDEPLSPDFIRDVAPELSALGCNAGTCHGSKDGKNGFKLSLRGYDPIYDVRALADDLAGRRINLASPADSLLLLKATAAVPHEGGQRTRPGERSYEILKSWIAEGAVLDPSTAKVKSLSISPLNPVAANEGDARQMRVEAIYGDGTRRDVTAEAFIESGNTEVVEAGEKGLMKALRRGEAPLLARYEGVYAATTMTVMGDREGFEWEEPELFNKIDEFAVAKWKRMKIRPSDLCSDTEFIRRVYLDLTGLPPSVEAMKNFNEDERDSRVKREGLVNQLIGSQEFIDYWANKWADLLQVNRKYLGEEGALLFRKWIDSQVKENVPYDRFVRDILTATGSNRENPPASYFKILRTPEDLMENTTHLFLGTRFNCNKCHDHPFERWTQDQYYEMSAFFSQVAFRKDPESQDKRIGGTAVEGSKPLYEVVYDKTDGDVIHQRTGQIAPAEFPFQAEHDVDKTAFRRERLAAWMTSPDNPYFAKSFVNRVWGYLLGVGLIEPIDDIRAGNPPSNPDLLNWLTQHFVGSEFDFQELVRTICHSRVYQLSIKPNPWNEDDTINFSRAIPKRLPSEVLFDAVHHVTGSKSRFPGLPRGTRAVQLPDNGFKLPDGFLDNLGRPSRESACECERSNELQLGSIMSLVSGPTIDQAISDPENAIADLVSKEADNEKLVNQLFLRILNRPAANDEVEMAQKAFDQIPPEHDRLLEQLADYEEKMAPVFAQREREWKETIESAEADLADYKIEIAEEEEELDRIHQQKLADAQAAVDAHEQAIDDKLQAWEGQESLATKWTLFDPSQMNSSATSSLMLQRDLSVFAGGESVDGTYSLESGLIEGNWTGLRLELIPDERLPKKGPGLAPDDGNCVLTEIEVFWTPKGGVDELTPIKLRDAFASFSQGGFPVANAIDGNKGNNNGWAIAPEMGKRHTAVFYFDKPFENKGTGILTVKLVQNYQSGKHAIGRFRLALTTESDELNFGLPDEIEEILVIDRSERSEEQSIELLDFFRGFDPERQALDKALEIAKKPRPENAGLVARRERLKLLSEPLPMDARLKELRRAVEISTAQMENQRLTAVQDIAWALINNPAFLFNH